MDEEITPEKIMRMGESSLNTWLNTLSPEKRLTGLSQKEWLAGLPIEIRLAGIPIEVIEAYLQKMPKIDESNV